MTRRTRMLQHGLDLDRPHWFIAGQPPAPLLVATFHVTGPPSYLPSPSLREAVTIALASGARVVAAHGSHVLAPVERRGEAVIAWGLGNLLFACDCTRESAGAILRISLAADGSLRTAILPIRAGLAGTPARLSENPSEIFDLLTSLRSSPLQRAADRAWF